MRYSPEGLAARIRLIRGKRTQGEFATLHETSQGYISDLERAKALPSFHFLVSLSVREGVSLDWLLSGREMPAYLPAEDAEAALVRENAPEVYRKVDQLLLINPNLSPTLLEFLDLFFKLEKK